MTCISCGGSDPRCPSAHPAYGFTCILPPHHGPHFDTAGGHWTMSGQLLGETRIRAAAEIAIVQREATPGCPADGPCPATIGEVADELAAFVRELDETCARGVRAVLAERLSGH